MREAFSRSFRSFNPGDRQPSAFVIAAELRAARAASAPTLWRNASSRLGRRGECSTGSAGPRPRPSRPASCRVPGLERPLAGFVALGRHQVDRLCDALVARHRRGADTRAPAARRNATTSGRRSAVHVTSPLRSRSITSPVDLRRKRRRSRSRESGLLCPFEPDLLHLTLHQGVQPTPCPRPGESARSHVLLA
jgi:hypothetical protein